MSQRLSWRIMGELRQDRISGQWTVIAPRRGERPGAIRGAHVNQPALREDQICPFCPGNEDTLPGIVAEYPAEATRGWSVRIVPNKYAAFTPDDPAPSHPSGEIALAAFGIQEVIIESPRHEADISTLNDDELFVVMRAYRDRFSALIGREGVACVTLFRNYGPLSGASLRHPHSQLIATELVSPAVRAVHDRALDYFERNSVCIFCEELKQELDASSRIVENNVAFVALVPFAAQYPFELWILPLRHQARFDEIRDNELEAFGLILRSSVQKMRRLHGDVSYNFVIDSATWQDFNAAHLHWRLRLVPQLTEWGGFELGTNIPINPSWPEDDAAALRTARGVE